MGRRAWAAVALVLLGETLAAAPVRVRFREGLVHGFLALRTLDGKTIADGDLYQTPNGDTVTSKLAFRFRDGSYQEETAVFTQGREFRLVSDHLVQKGPAFPRALDMTIDARGHVVVRYADDGREKVEDERMELPPDLANGLVLTLLKNLPADGPPIEVGMVAPTPKPRLVTLQISRGGQDGLRIGGTRRRAIRYVVDVHIGGVTGALAHVMGKDPPDTQVWILGGEAPAFLRSEGPMFADGPIWRIDLVSPTFPAAPPKAKAKSPPDP
jgi:hypothetical protein